MNDSLQIIIDNHPGEGKDILSQFMNSNHSKNNSNRDSSHDSTHDSNYEHNFKINESLLIYKDPPTGFFHRSVVPIHLEKKSLYENCLIKHLSNKYIYKKSK